MKKLRGKKLLFAIFAIVATGAVLVPAFYKIHNAKAVLTEEKVKTLRNEQVAIQSRNFSFAPDSGLRLISAAPEIRDVCEYQNKIFAATSSGLVTYSPDGKKLEQWNATEGLPSQDLTAVAVRDNALWIGTWNSGLFRFQNDSWQHFLPEKKELRSVTSLLSTHQGDLLIGTRDGIVRYSGRSFFPFHAQHFKGQTITRLAGDSYRLFVGTFGNGLYLLEKGTIRHFGINEGLSDLLITDIHQTETGCYVSTPAGIQVWRDNRFQTMASNLFVTSFFLESGILWAGTYDRGILPFKTSTQLHNSRKSTSLQTVAYTASGTDPFFVRKIGNQLIAFSKDESFYLSEGKRWVPWIHNSGFLSDQNISSLLRTKSGEFWVGYFDRGIDIFSSDFSWTGQIRDETFFCINHMAEDAEGRKYISTANGLAVIEPDGTRKIYKEKDGLLSDRVMQALPLDVSGKRVGIATAQGFTIKEGADFKSIYAFHGLVNNHVYSLASDGKQVFLGTLGGISKLFGMQVTENWTRMDSGLKRNWVNALAVVDHELYVGTYGSGLQIRSASGEWREAFPEEFEVNPNAFFFDGRYFFCGTLDRGFYFYDVSSKTWNHFEKGLPGQSVTAFAADSNHVYAATDHGLLQISYDKLNTLADSR